MLSDIFNTFKILTHNIVLINGKRISAAEEIDIINPLETDDFDEKHSHNNLFMIHTLIKVSLLNLTKKNKLM